jgi:50S ribosomal subunit-associated GTPase HflX
MYCRDADALMIVHDLSCPSSFTGCKLVYEIYRNIHTQREQDVYFVGNKVDLPFSVVKMDEARLYAESIGASYHVASAKTGDGVNALFHEMAERLIRKPKQSARLVVKLISEKFRNRSDCH